MRSRLVALGKRLVPVLLGALGLGAIVGLVGEAGPCTIARLMAPAWPLVLVMVLLEVSAGALDAAAVRSLYGVGGLKVPLVVWIRSAAVAVTCAHLLPGGRVLGEVARATALAPWVSAPRAAAIVIRAHGTYLVMISLTTIVCWGCVARTGASPILEGLLLFAAGFTTVLGWLFLVGPRYSGVGRWLGRRVGVLSGAGPRFQAALMEGRTLEPKPTAYYGLARAAHALSSCVALVAVGAACTAPHVFASEGIQLVAANTGDTVPGQAGVLEGAYRLFASSLGLGDAAAVAVAIALFVRASRLGVTVLAVGVVGLLSLPRRCSALATLALVATVISLPAEASAQHTAAPVTKLVVRQRAVGVINPMGAEHMVGVGVHIPLGDGTNPLLGGAHLELGANNYTSPVYSMTGAYAQLSPLAFLVLRAELSALTLWSIGMDGAGYYSVDDYDVDVSSQRFPGALGREASGYNLQLSTILQGAIQLGRFRPILWAQLMVEHERLGAEDFHYSPKYDLVLARSDWMITSSSMALLELSLSDTLGVRVGAYDDMRYVMASGALSHQVGATVMLSLDAPRACVRELLVFVRAGGYLEPERRAGQATGLVGLMARYDLADL